MTAFSPALTTAACPVLTTEHTRASTPGLERAGGRVGARYSAAVVDSGPFRAISRSRSIGRSTVLGVETDRFDDEVKFIGAVDLAGDTVCHVGLDDAGLGEIVEPVDALRIAVLEQEHGARRVFRPRMQEQVVGAEIEHGRTTSGGLGPPPIGSAVEGVARRTPPPRVSHSAAPAGCRRSTRPAMWRFGWVCASYRRRTGRSRSSRPGGRRSRWRWSC